MNTTIANICESWTMPLTEPGEGDQEWFLDWVLRAPHHAGTHLTSSYLALQDLTEVYPPTSIYSAWEPFAGMGAQALMVQELFSPEYHVVQDYSQQAAAHLRAVLPGYVHVRCADSYAPQNHMGADLVAADFGDLTVWKTREGQGHRDLLDQIFGVFGQGPKAVLLTDIAARYLHLHRERYETLLGPGTCGSYETYLDAFLARLQELYGYTLVSGYTTRWSTVMALVPEGAAEVGKIHASPERPVGLELL